MTAGHNTQHVLTSTHTDCDQNLLRSTQAFWARKLGRDVSVEEAEEILQQARLFVRLLIEHACSDEGTATQKPGNSKEGAKWH